jgi:polyphosphate glucokinase
MASKPGILSIDVGGSHIKADVLDTAGANLADRVRVPTPKPCTPGVFLETVKRLVAPLPAFDRISVGFPGFVKRGVVMTAPNLGSEPWAGFDLQAELSKLFGGRPCQVINDADMQGFGLITGSGLEMVLTVGTGMGSALFRDGVLMPHMELGHHPLFKKKTYEERLGNAGRKQSGDEKWNKRLRKALAAIDKLLNPDHIFIGGGNAEYIVQESLPAHVTIGDNAAGILGGAALWKQPRVTAILAGEPGRHDAGKPATKKAAKSARSK